MEGKFFHFDARLGIPVPNLQKEWDNYSAEEQTKIIFRWESIRGNIPDRIKTLEDGINHKQEKLYQEDSFTESCKLNTEIAELASIINDLWLLYRMDQHIESKLHK
mgnify:CR=1 FL=1